MIELARDAVPREVLSELAEVCVEKLKYNQINVLLQYWPYPSFKVKSKLFSESVNICDAISDGQDHEITRVKHHEQTRFLISVLKNILNHRNSEDFKIVNLDITNCPVDARVLYFSANSVNQNQVELDEEFILPGPIPVS